MQSELKTKAGTILPLMNLKGKPYLQVAHRLVWFREEHPDWGISTTLLEHVEGQYACVKASVTNADGIVMGQGMKVEHKGHFADYIEKAETGSVGRALAMCGYGTQFAPELDEGDRLADSPIQPVTYTRQQVAELAAKHGIPPAEIPASLAKVGVLPKPLPSNQWSAAQVAAAVEFYRKEPVAR